MTSTSYFFAQNKLGVATRTPRSSLDIVANDGIIFPVGTTSQRPVAPVTGTVRYNSDLNVLENYNGSYWDAVGTTTTYNNDAIPIGSILPHSSSIAPAGFLLCDGSAVSRTTYNDLFFVIGTTYGSGNGSTTFNLPDLRGRLPLGSGSGSGLTARTLGASGGTESKTLAVAELPPHSHTSTGYLLQGSLTSGNTFDVPLGSGSFAYQDVTTSIGSGQSFSIMNPFLVTNYIIKAIIFNGSNYSWTNNGSQLVTLNNVGINVTNPSAKLELSGNSILTGTTTIQGNLNLTNGSALLNSITITGNSLLNGATIINNDLTVSGSSTFNNSLNITGALSINNISIATTSQPINITTLSNLGITINANQNAPGVNTGLYLNCINTSLSSNVQTNSSSITLKNGAGDRNLQFFNNSSNLTSSDSIYGFLNSTGNYIMNMLNNGNIGIGTNNPASKFHIISTQAVDMRCQSDSSVNLENAQITAVQTNTNSASYAILRSAKNSVSGYQDWYWQLDSTGNYQLVQAGYNGTYNYTSRVFINNTAGNFGIGTQTPRHKLHTLYASFGGMVSENVYFDDVNVKNTLANISNNSVVGPYMRGDSWLGFYGRSPSGTYTYYAVNFGTLPFTGQHPCYSANSQLVQDPTIENYTGLIVYSTGQYKLYKEDTQQIFYGKDAITVNDSLPIIDFTSSRKDIRVFGVITDRENAKNVLDYTLQGNDGFLDVMNGRIRVNGVGEGGIWVCNMNGNLLNGNYIQSSNLRGYGERQEEYFICNFTVAKITCDVDFSDPNLSDKYQIRYLDSNTNQITYQQYQNNLAKQIPSYIACLVGCTYHSS